MPAADSAKRPGHGIGDREVVIGILLMLSATTIQPIQDSFTKYVGSQISPMEVIWARMFVQAALTFPFVVAGYGIAGLLPRPFGLQVLRGLFLGGTNVAFAFGVVLMPLADAIALVFIAPLMVTALSALILGEVVGRRRWTAVVIGLAGAAIVIRPGSGLFGLAALLPLSAAAGYAGYLIVTRRLTQSAPPVSTHFFTALVSVFVLAVPLALGTMAGFRPFSLSVPNMEQSAMLLAIGVLSTISHFLIILAYGRAPASTLAPISYFEIVGATTLGYLVFGDFPDFWTWVGVFVIVGSGLYVIFRARLRESESPDGHPALPPAPD